MGRVLGTWIRKWLSSQTHHCSYFTSVVSNSIPPRFVNRQVVSLFQFELLKMLFANKWSMIKIKAKKQKETILGGFQYFMSSLVKIT